MREHMKSHADVLELLREREYAEAVYHQMDRAGFMTIYRIQCFLEGHMEVYGNHAWTLPDQELLFWAGMSREFMDVIDELKGRIVAVNCSPMLYAEEGALPRYMCEWPKGTMIPYWSLIHPNDRPAVPDVSEQFVWRPTGFITDDNNERKKMAAKSHLN